MKKIKVILASTLLFAASTMVFVGCSHPSSSKTPEIEETTEEETTEDSKTSDDKTNTSNSGTTNNSGKTNNSGNQSGSNTSGGSGSSESGSQGGSGSTEEESGGDNDDNGQIDDEETEVSPYTITVANAQGAGAEFTFAWTDDDYALAANTGSIVDFKLGANDKNGIGWCDGRAGAGTITAYMHTYGADWNSNGSKDFYCRLRTTEDLLYDINATLVIDGSSYAVKNVTITTIALITLTQTSIHFDDIGTTEYVGVTNIGFAMDPTAITATSSDESVATVEVGTDSYLGAVLITSVGAGDAVITVSCGEEGIDSKRVAVHVGEGQGSSGTDWDSIEWIGNGSGNGDLTNKYKFTTEGAGSLVNIQQPDFISEAGIYITFTAGISACSLEEGAYHIEGAGIVVYCSAFTEQETPFTVTYAGGESTCYVYYAGN